MKIKDKEKFIALAEIALSDDKRICKNIRIKNLVRLADGDLSPFGSALIDGHEVVNSSRCGSAYFYDCESSDYKIKAKTITVFGVEVVPFTGEEFLIAKQFGVYAYGIVFNLDEGRFKSVLNHYPVTSVLNKTVFKREIDAKAVADAMNRLGGFYEE